MNDFIDYYSLLNVTPNADEELIKRAYRILSKKFHPDHGGDSQQFILLNQAYETLIDPYKRQRYNQSYQSYIRFKKEQEDRKKEQEFNRKFDERTSRTFSSNTNEKPQESKNNTSNPTRSTVSESPKKGFTATQFIIIFALVISVIIFVPSVFYETSKLSQEDFSENNLDALEGENVDSEDINIHKSSQKEDDSSMSSQEIELYEDQETFTEFVSYYEEYKDIQPSSELYKRYYTHLRDMEMDMRKDYTEVWEYGTYGEQSLSAQGYLTQWDEMLNEIYGVIKTTIPSNDFIDLRNLQRDWINQRDQKANRAVEYFKGGLQEEAIYYDSLLESTKKRCYWLIKNYLN